MLRVILLGLLLSSSSALGLAIPALDDPAQTCLTEDGRWPSVDGTKFYICNNGVPFEMKCTDGTFYLYDEEADLDGCYPYDELPSECAYQGGTHACTVDYLKTLQSSNSPIEYYYCEAENAEPKVGKCVEGRAFFKNDEGYMGCFLWADWREITGCKNGVPSATIK